jgi:hypothetical protein
LLALLVGFPPPLSGVWGVDEMDEYELVVAVPDWITPGYAEHLIRKLLEDAEVYLIEMEKR